MNPFAYRNVTVVLPDSLLENTTVVVRDGLIHEVLSSSDQDEKRFDPNCDVIDGGGNYLVPGFVDLHVHGGDGADVMDGTLASVQAVCDAHARRGTTSLFATTTTGSRDEITNAIEACRQYQQAPTSAHLEGVHLYGPYFAPDKVGCHSKAGRREPIAEEFDRYFASDMIRIATCAAEIESATGFYEAARKAGCLITCGHSNASWPEMQAAFDRGMRHVDHFWCAMSSVPSLRSRFGTPMQASMAEFVLLNQEMSTEVIADGHHLSAELLEFAYRMLGPKRLCLVSDANRALGMPPGDYRFGNDQTGSRFESDGEVGWAPGRTSLASSIQALDHMIRTMKAQTSATLPDLIRMASLTPAERGGIASTVGSIEAGKRANLVLLDPDLKVLRVHVDAREIPLHH